MTPTRPHHQRIWAVLEKFNSDYLAQNKIIFGGGTRIALELGEYRESTDIDFCCIGKDAYRAVRSEITTQSLGAILKSSESLCFVRDIRADRDAVRTFVSTGANTQPIKLEFIHFDYSELEVDADAKFPVPVLDQMSCWLNKLLANADRYMSTDKKDIFDLCMMHYSWGKIPDRSWQLADEIYGEKTIINGIEKATRALQSKPDIAFRMATESLMIKPALAKILITDVAPLLSEQIASIRK